MNERGHLALVVRKEIKASPERLFEAWTNPSQLQAWWGPPDTTCHSVEMELRVGGKFQIGNRFADGRDIWIRGEFQKIERPTHLVYVLPQLKRDTSNPV